jgi:ABC-type glycerol-3-phosphate transport system substrate-binding protein
VTTLLIWLPPQFDPSGGTRAGDLLAARLQEFESQNPGVKLEVRVKALEGAGGMLEALAAAHAAAPLAIADLIALPRPLLESAALKGLLHPYDGLSTVMESQDWFEYARDLARVQNSTFGLPFGGDALALAYRPTLIPEPPPDWSATLAISGTLLFPAADAEALFTLNQYQSAGGETQDEQGRPYLDELILTDVLTYYQRAEQVGVMPYTLTQYVTDDQVWQAFLQGDFPAAATWSSRLLGQQTDANLAGAPLPTADGAPFNLATGWVWALASPTPERQELGARLAEFLVAEDFLAGWTEAAGVLPPRGAALSGWKDFAGRDLASRLVDSAQLLPPSDVIASLGAALRQATLQVLKRQASPAGAAQAAVEGLNLP